MVRVEMSVHIDRPVAEVFAYMGPESICDLDSWVGRREGDRELLTRRWGHQGCPGLRGRTGRLLQGR